MDCFKKMANMKELPRKQEYCVDLLKKISFDLMKHKLAKPILQVLLSSNILSLFFGIYVFSFYTDHQHIMDVGPRWGFQMCLVLNLWTLLNKLKEYNDFADWYETFHLPYEIMDEKLNQKAEKKAKIVKLAIFSNYVIIFIAFVAVNSNQEQLVRKNYFLQWICAKLSGACSIKTFIISFVDAATYFVVGSCPICLLYLGISGIYRLMIINEIARNITTSQIPINHRYHSGLYQKMVQQKLKICIMLHSTVIRMSLAGGVIIYVNIIIMVFATMIGGTALIFAIVTAFGEEEYIVVIGWLLHGVSGFIILILYVGIGQLLENESERLWYILVQLPWYYMNEGNAKIYSLLLKKSEMPISMGTELVQMNFLLLLKIYRGLYTLAAFFMQMMMNNGEPR